MDLKKMNLQTLDSNETKKVNGGNGIHGAEYSNADMKPVGEFFAGVVVGLYNKLFY